VDLGEDSACGLPEAENSAECPSRPAAYTGAPQAGQRMAGLCFRDAACADFLGEGCRISGFRRECALAFFPTLPVIPGSGCFGGTLPATLGLEVPPAAATPEPTSGGVASPGNSALDGATPDPDWSLVAQRHRLG
jgi:hypothetical protein